MGFIDAEKFDNRFIRELPGELTRDLVSRQVRGVCWSPAIPTPVRDPRLVAWATDVAALLDLGVRNFDHEAWSQILSGNLLVPGMEPYAACYGGHQFGNWAGQLGDGRAIGLGEVMASDGRRWELQLKGAGPTPYSRTADGRAVLRSSLREFLCSEAMHHLGVPTTRALSLVTTGETVIRDMLYNGNPRPEAGAVVCRVAPSFIRFGNFEILAARGEVDLLERLIDFTIDRDFPDLKGNSIDRRIVWFRTVCERTATLIAHWMRVGFVHGVMNTDNMSILGLTLDYGPYGWIDNFDMNWTPNTTDFERRRYAFGKQPDIGLWNLGRLALAVSPALSDTSEISGALHAYSEVFNRVHNENNHRKFGLEEDGPESRSIISDGFALLQKSGMDMTNFFRMIGDTIPTEISFAKLERCSYAPGIRPSDRPQWEKWIRRYRDHTSIQGLPLDDRQKRMHRNNPCYVLRNYLAQEAIDAAENGDFSIVAVLMEALSKPYEEREKFSNLGSLRPDWARARVGCSMLSCSS